MFSIFLFLMNVFIDVKTPQITVWGIKSSTLSFYVGFFTEVSKNKELKCVLPFIISPTQVPVSYYMQEVLHLRQRFNYQVAARIVIHSQVAVLPLIS